MTGFLALYLPFAVLYGVLTWVHTRADMTLSRAERATAAGYAAVCWPFLEAWSVIDDIRAKWS